MRLGPRAATSRKGSGGISDTAGLRGRGVGGVGAWGQGA